MLLELDDIGECLSMPPHTFIRVGGPDFGLDLVAYVESVEVETEGVTHWRLVAGKPVEIRTHVKTKTAAVLVIQRGRAVRFGDVVIPPGTVWRTDASWLHEVIPWDEPLVPRLEESVPVPSPSWFVRP